MASAALRDQESIAANDLITVFLPSPTDKAWSCSPERLARGGMSSGWCLVRPAQPAREEAWQQLSSASPPPAASERSHAGPLWVHRLQRAVDGQEVEIHECPEQKGSYHQTIPASPGASHPGGGGGGRTVWKSHSGNNAMHGCSCLLPTGLHWTLACHLPPDLSCYFVFT